MPRYIPFLVILFAFGCVGETRQWNLNEAISESQRIQEVVESLQTDALFVQWQPNPPLDTSNYIDVVFKRQEVEKQIGASLKRRALGRHIAGEVGESGANMLFQVNDFEQSTKVVLEVLRENGIKDEVVIAQRHIDSKNNFTYEIIFRSDSSRQFKAP